MPNGGRALFLGLLAVTPIVPGVSSCASTSAPPGDGQDKSASETRPLYLREAEIPRVARAGAPIEIVVRGDLPTPGWKFLKWEIREDEAGTWSVTPLIVDAQAPGVAVPQVLVPFEGSAMIVEQPAGAPIEVVVRGFSPEETVSGRVEIVPANTLLDLSITGGFAGISSRVRIADDGAIEASRSTDGRHATGRLSAEDLARVRAAVESARLAELPAHSITENAADLFFYDVTDFGGERPIRVVADDLAMTPGLTALIRILRDEQDNLLERPAR